MKVAIFDFDGTLYEKETFPLLMEQLKSHPIYHKQYNRFYISIIPTYVAHRLRLMSTSRMRTNMMKKYLNVFEGFREEEIIAYYEEIAEVMKEDFNPKVIAALEKHVADGVHVMLVSGAFMPLLKPVVGHLPFDDIIGTEIPYRDGLYDSDGDFLHIQASRKTEVINAALAGKSIDWENSFAYGDSFSDLAVLEMVGNPVAVRPDTRLQAHAEKNGWEILL